MILAVNGVATQRASPSSIGSQRRSGDQSQWKAISSISRQIWDGHVYSFGGHWVASTKLGLPSKSTSTPPCDDL